MPTAPGDLRHRVELQSSVETVDSYGQPIRAWTTYATVWAQVESLGGGESPTAGQVQATTRRVVTIRHRDDVLAEHRLVWRTRNLHPTVVRDPDGLRTWMVLETIEREAGT